jgi:hypothetical protein
MTMCVSADLSWQSKSFAALPRRYSAWPLVRNWISSIIPCSGCKHFRPISDFYKKQPPDLTTNALQTCAKCRSLRIKSRSSKKRSPQNIEPATPPAKKLRNREARGTLSLSAQDVEKELRELAPASSSPPNFRRAGDRSPERIAKQARDREARGRTVGGEAILLINRLSLVNHLISHPSHCLALTPKMMTVHDLDS